MSYFSHRRQRDQSRPVSAPSHRRKRARLSLEGLENRQMMAGLVYRRPPVTAPPADPPVIVAPPITPAPTTPPAGSSPVDSSAVFGVTQLGGISSTESTGEKPQSKVWQHDGRWFAVMPDSSGTWVFRLDDATWSKQLQLSTSTAVHADVKKAGNVAHILLFEGSTSQLASIQYVAASASYQPWSVRPTNANVPLPASVETATIDIDSTGRMWVVSDGANDVVTRYSDGDYSTWSDPTTLETNTSSDDISRVIAMPGGKIGVFWSNQNTQRFGFRTHIDGTDPNLWTADEVPAGAWALSQKGGLADDHLNLAATSDGTLYAGVKTSYDTSGFPKMMLLVRRPNGVWDAPYSVDESGTRAVVVVSEATNRLFFIQTKNTGGGDIIYRETRLDAISFSAPKVLLSGNYNDPTTTRDVVTNEVVVLASKGSTAGAAMLKVIGAPSNPPTDPDPTPDPPPIGAPAVLDFQDGVSQSGSYNGTRDASMYGDSSTVRRRNYGTSRELQTNGNPDRSALLAWDVSSIAPGRVVTAAEISLQITGTSVETFSLYALKKSWNETQVTWNQSSRGTNWSSAGAQGTADRDGTSIGTLTATAKGLAKITLNAAGIALVQSWVNDPSSNYGIAIQNYSGKADSLAFASREASNAADRPKLSIAYSGSAAMTQSLALAIAAGLDATKKS